MESSGIIYLVRHCATCNDAMNYPVMVGQKLPYGLSAAGEEQAKMLSSRFTKRAIEAVYCSPLARAVSTAQIICEQLDEETPITFCTSLTEVDMGRWEGKTRAEVMTADGAAYDRYLRDPGTYGFPDGESFTVACSRMMSMLSRIMMTHPRGRVLVVSHKYAIRTVLAGLQSLPLHRAREIELDPGCVNLIRVFRGNMDLRAVNQTEAFDAYIDEEEESCDSTFDMIVK